MRSVIFALLKGVVSASLLVVIVAALCVSAIGQAQATAADLTGLVVDPNDAIVNGATVTARNSAAGITRTATTDDDGVYKFIGLPPGEYEISAEAPNFKK